MKKEKVKGRVSALEINEKKIVNKKKDI